MKLSRSHVLGVTVGLLVAACGGTGTGGDDARPDAAGGGADAGAVDAGATPTDDASAYDAAPADDGSADGLDATPDDAAASSADAATPDAMTAPDAATPDAMTAPDATVPDAAPPDAMPGVISGGPCISGAPGATAYRVRWAGGGGTAYPFYEVNGLPDTSRDHVGAYGYSIGYTPAFVDIYLGEGGLQLDGSNFVDIELSTVGVSSIGQATLSIYGRSYNTTASGSFNWQTFSGIGAAPTNLVSNSAPYEWYSADMTTELAPGDDGVLLRIKAGPSSGSLVVNRIEICMQAE